MTRKRTGIWVCIEDGLRWQNGHYQKTPNDKIKITYSAPDTSSNIKITYSAPDTSSNIKITYSM